MPPSSTLNPNARPFRPSPNSLVPVFPPTQLSATRLVPFRPAGTAPVSRIRNETGSRPPPLAPIPCDVLDRRRTHYFGAETRLPHAGTTLTRIRAASNIPWKQHRQGQPPEVRPGSVVAPQTLYTGHETRPNGQELFHATFLNARMLIQNPLTGHPGMVNGHVLATLVAAPADETTTWPFEIPYPSHSTLRTALPNMSRAIHNELGQQRMRGQHQLNVDRSITRLPGARNAMHTTRGIPPAPALPPVPLPLVRSRVPQRARSTPPASAPANDSPYTTVPLNVALRQLGNQNIQYYLTHPPNVLPHFDISQMTRIGIDAKTGHHVLRLPPLPQFDAPYGELKRPSTPGPPFRLLTERPVLLEDAASEDESMPPASPIAEGPLVAEEERGRRPRICSPVPRGWAQSNARLEKLQASAGRCAPSANPAQTSGGLPPFVFSVYRSLAALASPSEAPAVPSVESVGGDHPMDMDEPVVVESHNEETKAAIDFSRHGSEEDPEAVREYASSPSSLSSLSLISSNSHTYEHVQPPASDNASSNNSTSDRERPISRASTPYPADCRSTNQSPQLRPLFLKGSDTGSLPSLVEIPSEEGSLREEESGCVARDVPFLFADDKGRAAPITSGHSDLAGSAVLNEQIGRIARPPSTPFNRTWPHIKEWTRHQAEFVSHVHNLQHEDALTFIRQADALAAQSPEILDEDSMAVDAHVDHDLVNQDGVSISDEECQRFADRVQSIRGAVMDHSPDFASEPRCIPNLTSAPVSQDGSRHRLFSKRALEQPLEYRYTIYILARLHPDWIDVYTVLRCKVLAFNHYFEDLFRRRGWVPDETLLHQPAPIQPPYLKPQEYARLRLFKYTLAFHGYDEVVREIDEFLQYRFREPEVVAHFLHSGLFETRDLYLDGASGETFVTRRTGHKSHRASSEYLRSFRRTNVSL
ncbi:hypothetical protein DFH06DRAFT_1315485 [Mycena polygramma]|nr:hypothetical protein DFH06DRAFT_1315485 [Mycena polygramma]